MQRIGEWQKSSRCEVASCVEVANLGGNTVGYRDTKDPSGAPLIVSALAHTAFIAALKAGELTGPEART